MDLIDAVRIEIGDSENGILPGQRQVPTAHFAYAASVEGVVDTSNPTAAEIGRVCAKVLEIAANEWAIVPVESELGPASEVRKTRDDMRKEAARLRGKWGYGGEESATDRTSRTPAYSSHGGYFIVPGIE